jgi:hypothetical protein
MEKALKRHAARLLLGGREAALIRYALASRYSVLFARPPRTVSDRFALYDLVSSELICGRSFDYLEFGVFEGASLARVAERNKEATVRLFGFDSFEGLPFDWNGENPKGMFSTSGRLPRIADDRIQLIKGWFEQTLPAFLIDYRPQKQLWIHIDADLYGSAMAALTLLNPHIGPGCIIVFDEIEDLMNEFKALCDFQDMSRKRLEVFAATEDRRQAAFICR